MSNQQSGTDATGPASKAAATPPPVQYIHHLKFPVTDVDRSVTFYEQVFGAQELTKLTHKDDNGEVYARVVQIPGFQPMVELWISAASAKAQAGYDFLTLAVKDRAALDSWSKYLDSLGIDHSGILTAIDSWLLVFEDPDGHRMRFYSLEEHPITHDVSTDKRWLSSPLHGDGDLAWSVGQCRALKRAVIAGIMQNRLASAGLWACTIGAGGRPATLASLLHNANFCIKHLSERSSASIPAGCSSGRMKRWMLRGVGASRIRWLYLCDSGARVNQGQNTTLMIVE